MKNNGSAHENGIGSWVNAKYADDYKNGVLCKNHLRLEPFKHVVLQDFFQSYIIDNIKSYCRSIQTEPSKRMGFTKEADWLLAPFGEVQTLRFIFSPPFITFLNALLGEQLRMSADSIPQYNCFLPNSKGLPIHNDSHNAFDVVMLLQLTEAYPSGGGGELCFYRSTLGYTEFLKVPPVENTLILFKIEKNSYHSVADMHGEWKREVLAFDWHLKNKPSMEAV